MDGFSHCDDVSEFDSFLNHEFLCGADKSDEEFRGAESSDSPSTFHSPQSMQSELTELTGTTAFDAANGASALQLDAFDALSFSHQPGDGSAVAATGHPFEKDPFLQHLGAHAAPGSQAFSQPPGIDMWRSVSEGTSLSQSISSLGLDNVPQLPAAPFPFRQDAPQIKQEDSSGASSCLPFLDAPMATPMQQSVGLPCEAVTSPRSEKKRKLSATQIDHSFAGAPGAGDGARPRDGALKKAGKKKTKAAESAAAAGPSSSASIDGRLAEAESSANGKSQKKAGQRRPPPSASQITEAGNPFPVIDTSAKHSSLFVHPDTSGLTKREARLVKNRAAAFLSRQRKREQFEELEVKCKAMSIMAWRMWEVIAGPGAPIEMLNRTVLPTLLRDEDPMAIVCLEQIIAKQGASIAPTADDALPQPNRDSAEPEQGNGSVAGAGEGSEGAISSRPWQADAIDRLKAELVASRQREQNLLFELEVLKQAGPAVAALPTPPVAGTATPPLPPPTALPFWQTVPEAAAPFRNAQPMAPSLTIAPGLAPHGATSSVTPGLEGSVASSSSTISSGSAGSVGTGNNGVGKLKVEEMDVTFDFAATPTIESFSEAARKHKMLQLSGPRPPKLDLGLGAHTERARLESPCRSSGPSSPSTLSSCSDATHRGSASAATGQLANPRRTASSMALMVILFSIALLGMPANDLAKLGISRSSGTLNSGFSLGQVLGPVEPTSRYSLIRAPTDDDEEEAVDDDLVAATQPSSHLSDTDLSLGFDSTTADSHLPASSSSSSSLRRAAAVDGDSEMVDVEPCPAAAASTCKPPAADHLFGSSTIAAIAAIAAIVHSKKAS
ncbi:hypothetical protein ACQY0O_004857 [Thecaphora frezii]